LGTTVPLLAKGLLDLRVAGWTCAHHNTLQQHATISRNRHVEVVKHDHVDNTAFVLLAILPTINQQFLVRIAGEYIGPNARSVDYLFDRKKAV
jgi:hypothetical protein